MKIQRWRFKSVYPIFEWNGGLILKKWRFFESWRRCLGSVNPMTRGHFLIPCPKALTYTTSLASFGCEPRMSLENIVLKFEICLTDLTILQSLPFLQVNRFYCWSIDVSSVLESNLLAFWLRLNRVFGNCSLKNC